MKDDLDKLLNEVDDGSLINRLEHVNWNNQFSSFLEHNPKQKSNHINPFARCYDKVRIPSHESIEFMKKYKWEDENFYLTSIPDNLIPKDFYRDLENQFSNLFLSDLKPEFNWEYFATIKLCWLSSELIKNKKFRSHIGAHWNPRLRKVIPHPGSQRYKVLYFFDKTSESKYLFWNTNGIKFDWMKEEDIIPLDKDDKLLKQYYFGLTLDHGGFIPHPCLDRDGPMDDSSVDYYKTVYNNLKSNKVYIDNKNPNKFLVDTLKKYTSTQDKATIQIHFKKQTKKAIYKSLIIFCLACEFEDSDIKVKFINQ